MYNYKIHTTYLYRPDVLTIAQQLIVTTIQNIDTISIFTFAFAFTNFMFTFTNYIFTYLNFIFTFRNNINSYKGES